MDQEETDSLYWSSSEEEEDFKEEEDDWERPMPAPEREREQPKRKSFVRAAARPPVDPPRRREISRTREVKRALKSLAMDPEEYFDEEDVQAQYKILTTVRSLDDDDIDRLELARDYLIQTLKDEDEK
uniref:Uncharacterized protein n=1 Tax=Lotharella oceanica TaxID=641309 RepID=A0A7S2XC45_9EUKA